MWALGCVCFELCTFSLPFVAKSVLELALQVMEGDPAWTLWEDKDFSAELRDVTQRLLHKEMEARPTAAVLLAEPFFAEGGRGAQFPSEDAWASLIPAPPDFMSEGDVYLETVALGDDQVQIQ